MQANQKKGKLGSGRALPCRFKDVLYVLNIVLIFSLILVGCSSGESEAKESRDEVSQGFLGNSKTEAAAPIEKLKDGEVTKEENHPLSSSAARIGKADSTHTFIRTADIKFKVKDVTRATYKIEDIVGAHDGFVSFTNLASNVLYTNRTKINEDSILESTHYRVDNSITIRVPSTQLDSVLRALAPLMDFLDHRTIKADNIRFELIANQMAEARLKKYNERLTTAIDKRGKKLNETSNAEDNLLTRQESSDKAQLQSMELMEQVEYSTVTLYIYQPETINYSLSAVEKTPAIYEPSFGSRLTTAAKMGWYVLKEIIIFLVQMWGIILLGFGIYWGIKKAVQYFSKPEIKKA